jgi:hypothetical protein
MDRAHGVWSPARSTCGGTRWRCRGAIPLTLGYRRWFVTVLEEHANLCVEYISRLPGAAGDPAVQTLLRSPWVGAEVITTVHRLAATCSILRSGDDLQPGERTDAQGGQVDTALLR